MKLTFYYNKIGFNEIKMNELTHDPVYYYQLSKKFTSGAIQIKFKCDKLEFTLSVCTRCDIRLRLSYVETKEWF